MKSQALPPPHSLSPLSNMTYIHSSLFGWGGIPAGPCPVTRQVVCHQSSRGGSPVTDLGFSRDPPRFLSLSPLLTITLQICFLSVTLIIRELQRGEGRRSASDKGEWACRKGMGTKCRLGRKSGHAAPPAFLGLAGLENLPQRRGVRVISNTLEIH